MAVAFASLSNFVLSGKGNRYLLFVNLCLSLAALTKGVFVYCWIPNMAFHFWLFLRTHRKTVLLLSLIPLLTVSCWSYRNYKRTGVFHFSSISQKQQGYLVKRYWKRERAAFARENPGQLRQGDDYTTAKRGVEYSFLKVVARNWQDYTLYHMRGVLFFFLDPGRFDIYQVLGWSQQEGLSRYMGNSSGTTFQDILAKARELPIPIVALLTLIGTVNLVILGAFSYFVFRPHVQPELKVFLILIVFYVAFVTGGIGRSRYRLPVMPFLLLTAPTILRHFGKSEVRSSKHGTNSKFEA